MRFESMGGWKLGHYVFVMRELVAVDEDVLVGSTSTFGSYYVGIILFCYFVNDANKTLLPAILVVSWRFLWDKVGLLRGRGRRGDMAIFGVCKAGFNVGQASEVEGHD